MDPCMREADLHARTAELRARMIYGWARSAGREQRARACGTHHAPDPVADALVGLESDLSYLEELPAGRIDSLRAALEEAAGRLERLAASPTEPAS